MEQERRFSTFWTLTFDLDFPKIGLLDPEPVLMQKIRAIGPTVGAGEAQKHRNTRTHSKTIHMDSHLSETTLADKCTLLMLGGFPLPSVLCKDPGKVHASPNDT